MPYVGKKPADIIATSVDTDTGDFSGAVTVEGAAILNGGIDVAGDIILDVGGADIIFKDDGTQIGRIRNVSSGELTFQSDVQDKDIVFNGNDGGSTATALTLDMSDAGTAIFGHDLKVADNNNMQFGAGADLILSSDGTNGTVANLTSNGDLFFKGNDGGSTITALTLDMSSAGKAIFNAGLAIGGTGDANTISDYEEGTFTPTWNGYSPAGTTGRYTKIGRQVMVYTELITGGSTDTSEVQIDNLPFTVSGSLGGGTVYHNNTGLYPSTPLTLMTANSTVCKLKTVVGSGNEVGVKYNDGSSQPTLGGSATLRWAIFYETS